MRLRKIPQAEIKLLTYQDWLLSISPSKLQLPKNWINGSIYLEIGCGKCNFIYESAVNNPDINFIALEREASILLIGIRKIDKLAQKVLPNLRFICGEAENFLNQLQPQSIDRIFLNFPDPWPKRAHHKRRLISKNFLNQYSVVLKPAGTLLFKTDNVPLFVAAQINLTALNWSVDLNHDLWPINRVNQNPIISEYEQKFRTQNITIAKLIAKPKNKKT